mmetsp:Transcript_9475/g.31083  ORF Transcript_9475/g.31083 Transcript_9475/m.31083 type:complete len:383 (+) Transcript_9475:141-1289(+)
MAAVASTCTCALPHIAAPRRPAARSPAAGGACVPAMPLGWTRPFARAQRQIPRAAASMASYEPSEEELTIPERMSSLDASKGAVVTYRVNLVTSNERGAALDEPDSAVLLTLVGKNGAAFMHRVSAWNETDSNGGFYQQRFQEGMVDEIVFSGPDLGGVQALWVAPEAGAWELEEATLRVGDEDGASRFLCGRILGEGGDMPAAELRPIPEGVAVPEGPAVLSALRSAELEAMSPEERAALRARALAEYEALKAKLLGVTALLVAAGTAGMSVGLGDAAAINFAAGGAGGLLYTALLARGVDAIGGGLGSEGEEALAGGLAGSPAIRYGVVAALIALAVKAQGEGGIDADVGVYPTLLEGGLGFFMYKVAVLGVGLGAGEEE